LDALSASRDAPSAFGTTRLEDGRHERTGQQTRVCESRRTGTGCRIRRREEADQKLGGLDP
jgi:hypothetical protein